MDLQFVLLNVKSPSNVLFYRLLLEFTLYLIRGRNFPVTFIKQLDIFLEVLHIALLPAELPSPSVFRPKHAVHDFSDQLHRALFASSPQLPLLFVQVVLPECG